MLFLFVCFFLPPPCLPTTEATAFAAAVKLRFDPRFTLVATCLALVGLLFIFLCCCAILFMLLLPCITTLCMPPMPSYPCLMYLPFEFPKGVGFFHSLPPFELNDLPHLVPTPLAELPWPPFRAATFKSKFGTALWVEEEISR